MVEPKQTENFIAKIICLSNGVKEFQQKTISFCIRSLVWKAVSTAADLLMDMVLESQEKSTSDEWPVQSVTGDATDVKGGSSLKFEEHLDDSTSIDPILIKKIAFQAIQLLHFETRY